MFRTEINDENVIAPAVRARMKAAARLMAQGASWKAIWQSIRKPDGSLVYKTMGACRLSLTHPTVSGGRDGYPVWLRYLSEAIDAHAPELRLLATDTLRELMKPVRQMYGPDGKPLFLWGCRECKATLPSARCRKPRKCVNDQCLSVDFVLLPDPESESGEPMPYCEPNEARVREAAAHSWMAHWVRLQAQKIDVNVKEEEQHPQSDTEKRLMEELLRLAGNSHEPDDGIQRLGDRYSLS